MAKIESLTPEQERALVAHRDYWLKTGLSTETADRGTTERVITEFYRMRGLDAPYFWWCDGPMVAQLVLNILSNEKFKKQLGDNLGDNLWANLWANLWDNKLEYFSTNFWGSLDSYWIAYYLYPEQYLALKYDTDKSALLALWTDLSRSTFWWWPFEKIVVLSDRPSVIQKNPIGRLHCETGPACAFRDSWMLWYLDGQVLTEEMWKKIVGKEMTFGEIMKIENADIRACALKYNPEAMITSGSKLIDISKRGNSLYLIEGTELNTFLEEPEIWFLKMECPTGRTFVEGVDPAVAKKSRKADECQAHALGITPTQYKNLVIEG